MRLFKNGNQRFDFGCRDWEAYEYMLDLKRALSFSPFMRIISEKTRQAHIIEIIALYEIDNYEVRFEIRR